MILESEFDPSNQQFTATAMDGDNNSGSRVISKKTTETEEE
jgi:hypothetical protein